MNAPVSPSEHAAQRREQIHEVRGAVHDGLGRRIVAKIIMIYDEARVERRVLVRVVQSDAAQILIYGPLHRADEQHGVEGRCTEMVRHE
jgi:hypothetical protein